MRGQMLLRVVAFVVVAVFTTAAFAQSSRVVVVDAETREPIAGATVQSSPDREAVLKAKAAEVASSAEPGVFVVPHVSSRATLYARAFAPGCSSAMVTYDTDAPAEVEIPLPNAVAIGGTVVDAAGKPLADATLSIDAIADADWHTYEAGVRSQIISTDAQGRFTLADAPDGLLAVRVQVVHPDIIPFRFDTERRLPDETVDAMLAGTARLAVPGGGNVYVGVVKDASGEPIAEAEVYTGVPSGPDALLVRRTTTDAQGRWELRNVVAAPQGVRVTARRPGHVAMTGIATGQSTPLELILPAPRRVSGVVRDQAGQKVPGARVIADPKGNTFAAIVRAAADANGAFALEDAPAGRIVATVVAPGYVDGSLEIGPDDREVTATLEPRPAALRVRGTVVDDATGEPIAAFRVLSSVSYSADVLPIFIRDTAHFARNGRFEARPHVFPGMVALQVGVRIEADGYEPWTNPEVSTGSLAPDRIVTVDARLRKAGPAITGRVVDVDGKPVAGAFVYLATERAPVRLRTDQLRPGRNLLAATTDARGGFALPSQGDVPFQLLAATERGKGSATDLDRQEGREVVITMTEPWGSIAGSVADDAGLTRAGVYLQGGYVDPKKREFVDFWLSSYVRPDNTFRIDRVPAGQYTLGFYAVDGRPGTSSQFVNVKVEPGKTARADFGTAGRAIVGRLVPPAGEKIARWDGIFYRLGPAVAVPEGVNASAELRRQFRIQLLSAPEFAEWRNSPDRNNPQEVIEVAADGSFKLPRARAGLYSVSATGFEPVSDPDQGSGAAIAEADVLVTVELIGDDEIDADTPIELGELTATPRPGPRLGKPVGPIVGTLADGGAFDLSAYRGKVVVLEYWSGSSPLLEGRVPAVRPVLEAWTKPDSPVAVVGMNADQDADTARTYLAERNGRWPHVLLGTWDVLPTQLGHSGLPAILVLDRDHNLAAIRPTDEQLVRLVEKLIKQKPLEGR